MRVHQFLVHAESGVTVLIFILIIKVDCSGKDFILGLSDDWKSSDFQNRWEPTKSSMNCKHYKKAESLDKSSWINGFWRQAASLKIGKRDTICVSQFWRTKSLNKYLVSSYNDDGYVSLPKMKIVQHWAKLKKVLLVQKKQKKRVPNFQSMLFSSTLWNHQKTKKAS